MDIPDFEYKRNQFLNQYHEPQWQCGEAPDVITPELEKSYSDGETKHIPYAVTKARILAYILDHIRLAVNDFDPFAVLCERNESLSRFNWKRFGEILPRAIGNEMWETRCEAERAGYYGTSVDFSHTSPDWDAILTLGAPGLLARAEAGYARSKTPFYEAEVITYSAFRRFILRFSEVARIAGRNDLAEMTDFLADHAPVTLQQALELGWLYREMQEMDGELVRSMGIFDRQYFPFYQHDLEEGILTKDSALQLLLAYFSHCSAQASLGANVHYCFGGLLPDGIHDGCNDLTRLAFSAFRQLGVVDPKFSLRVNDKTPEDILHFAAETIKEGKSAILFINETVVREAFLRNGKESADLHNFIPIGCYEPAIMGKELCCSMTGRLNMVKPLEIMMRDTAFAPADFEDVQKKYLDLLSGTLNTMMDQINAMEPYWPDLNPTNTISGTMVECMERGLDASAAGTKYTASGIMCAGIGTVADSLAAIRELVFERKLVSFEQLRLILANNWNGQEKLRQIALRRAPKWGASNDIADQIAKRVCEAAADTIERHANSKGGHFQMGLWSIDFSLSYGKLTGATPDGRHAGDPISKNTGASIGCDKEGIAGLVESVTKLDHSRFPDGSVLDVMIPAQSVSGEAGTQFIVNVFRTFLAKGGAFMHYNILSAKMLRAAQAEPEKYRNLQIRLCGWNVRFIDLGKDMQDCLIREAESKEA